MKFDWELYLTLADSLRMDSSNEAALRSAISRAYYAAFCTARNYVSICGLPLPKDGNVHHTVWTFLQKQSDRNLKSIGMYGGRLQKDRNMADYDDEIEQNIKKLAESASITAHMIVDGIKKKTNKSSA